MSLKPFQQYIFELSKPSEFRIKLAGINPKGDVMDRIKNALEAYELDSISAVKSLPIQEHREFPQWGGPCEAWTFDVKLKYPTTTVAIMQVIKERASINPDWIHVRNMHEANYTDEAEARGKDNKSALLDQQELKDEPGAQELAGQKRIGSLLKELESRKFEFAADDSNKDKIREPSSKKGKTTNDLPLGTTAPVNAKQNKTPRGK